jgi:hypothetical protein
MCYAVVMGFMFALSDLPEVTVAIAQPLVPALALGMSALLGMEILSFVSLGGIFMSIAGMLPGSCAHGVFFYSLPRTDLNPLKTNPSLKLSAIYIVSDSVLQYICASPAAAVYVAVARWINTLAWQDSGCK